MIIRRRIIFSALAVVTIAVIVAAVGIVMTLADLNGIHRSDISMPDGGVAQNTGEVNILVMGLDSPSKSPQQSHRQKPPARATSKSPQQRHQQSHQQKAPAKAPSKATSKSPQQEPPDRKSVV